MRTDRLAVFGALLAMVLVSAPPAFGQWTPKRVAADGSEIPRTPWGHPDLQGLWNNSTTTPLERLTREEQAQSRRAQQAVIEATRGDRRRVAGAGGEDRARVIDRRSSGRPYPHG